MCKNGHLWPGSGRLLPPRQDRYLSGIFQNKSLAQPTLVCDWGRPHGTVWDSNDRHPHGNPTHCPLQRLVQIPGLHHLWHGESRSAIVSTEGYLEYQGDLGALGGAGILGVTGPGHVLVLRGSGAIWHGYLREYVAMQRTSRHKYLPNTEGTESNEGKVYWTCRQ